MIGNCINRLHPESIVTSYRLFIRLRTYFQGSKSGMQSVYKLGFWTHLQGTVCLGGAFLYGFRTYLQGTVDRECSLILLFPNQHPGICLLGVHPVLRFTNLSPGDCLPGGYILFIRIRTYFQRSKSVVQSVYKVSKPTCRELHPGNCLLGVHS